MSIKLEPGKKIVREIVLRVANIPIIVTITSEGITIAAKRSRKPLTIEWGRIVDNSMLPDNISAKFYGQPLIFLQSENTRLNGRYFKTVGLSAVNCSNCGESLTGGVHVCPKALQNKSGNFLLKRERIIKQI
jgi:hypothetical protein